MDIGKTIKGETERHKNTKWQTNLASAIYLKPAGGGGVRRPPCSFFLF